MRTNVVVALLAFLVGGLLVAAGATPAYAAAAATSASTTATTGDSATGSSATTAGSTGSTTPKVAPKTTLEDVERELMCSTCRVPLNQSDAPQAQQERQTIERLIAEGRTKDEIIDEMVEIYSETVLIDPPEAAVRTLRWLLPTVGAVLAFLVVGLLVRRWRRQARADDQDNPGPDAPTSAAEDGGGPDDDADDDGLTDDERRRLDSDLARYE